jgi:S1-C subfamily serine protease
LGIQGMSVTPELAQVLNLPAGQKGVLVEQVEVNSPADEAGLHGSFKPMMIAGERITVGGDIITAIDQQPVSQIEDLQRFLQQAEPGQKVTLTLLREGNKMDVALTLGEQPAGPIS